MDTANEQIRGVYRGKIEALHYVNAASKRACTTPAGLFLAGFKLSQTQLDLLLSEGNVR
jgi:hypothetical protein